MTTAEKKWIEKTERDSSVEQCPICGNEMKELLRAEESKSVFIWFECSKADCPGRWLKQYTLA
jgi:hypothetical protein